MSISQMIGAGLGLTAAIGLGILLWRFYRKGRKDERRDILMRSAEELAESNLRVEKEARRTHEAVESVSPDTPTSIGSRLLSGARDWLKKGSPAPDKGAPR